MRPRRDKRTGRFLKTKRPLTKRGKSKSKPGKRGSRIRPGPKPDSKSKRPLTKRGKSKSKPGKRGSRIRPGPKPDFSRPTKARRHVAEHGEREVLSQIPPQPKRRNRLGQFVSRWTPPQQRIRQQAAEVATVIGGAESRRAAAYERERVSEEIYGSRESTPYLRGRVAVAKTVDNRMSDRFLPTSYRYDRETNTTTPLTWKDLERKGRIVDAKVIRYWEKKYRKEAEAAYLKRVYDVTDADIEDLDPAVRDELLNFNDY